MYSENKSTKFPRTVLSKVCWRTHFEYVPRTIPLFDFVFQKIVSTVIVFIFFYYFYQLYPALAFTSLFLEWFEMPTWWILRSLHLNFITALTSKRLAFNFLHNITLTSFSKLMFQSVVRRQHRVAKVNVFSKKQID